MSRFTSLACVLLTAFLCGCPQGDAPVVEPQPDTQSKDAPAASALPADLFLATRPADAVKSLKELKTTAKVGDEVTFEARIGGRVEPFVKDRAMFIVADGAFQSCLEMDMDEGCKTPWDYCCEMPEAILANTATIRFVDASGAPLKVDVKDQHGLKGSARLVVRGKVQEAADGILVVDADGVFVDG